MLLLTEKVLLTHVLAIIHLLLSCPAGIDTHCRLEDNGECSTGEPQNSECKDFNPQDAVCDVPVIRLDSAQSKIIVEGSDEELVTELSRLLHKKAYKRLHPVAALVKMHWRTSPVMLRGGGVLCNPQNLTIADSKGQFKLPATLSTVDSGNTISWNKDKYNREPTEYPNISFSELAELMSGSLTEEDLFLPKHWQGRLFPQSRPRGGFITEEVARRLNLQDMTNPPNKEPLLDFPGSGFWAESEGTRTAFHYDPFAQVIVPCAGTKLWHLIPGPVRQEQVPGTGAWVMTPKFDELLDFAWTTFGPFSFCSNGKTWRYSSGNPPTLKSCMVSPGDILYLPFEWGHDVHALNSSVHINFRFKPVYTDKDILRALEYQGFARSERPV